MTITQSSRINRSAYVAPNGNPSKRLRNQSPHEHGMNRTTESKPNKQLRQRRKAEEKKVALLK